MLVFGFLLVPLVTPGQAGQSKWKDLKFVSTDQLKAMFDANEDFLLINALSPIEFAEIRIRGSVNIPFDYMKRGTANLPKEKGKKLIFYCKGPR